MVWPRFSKLSTPIESDLPDVPTFNTTETPGVLTQLAYVGLYPVQGVDTSSWYHTLKGRRPDFEDTLKPHNLAQRLNYAERRVCLERFSQVKIFSRSLLSAARDGSLTKDLARELDDLDHAWVSEKLRLERDSNWNFASPVEPLPWSQCPSDAFINSGLEKYKEVMAYCTDAWMGESSQATGGTNCRDLADSLSSGTFEKKRAALEVAPVSSLFVLLTVLAGIAGFVYIISRLLKWLEEQTQENRRLSESNRRLSNALMFPDTAGAGTVEVEESVPDLAPRRKSRARRGE